MENHTRQRLRFHVGSDDGGKTWRALKPGERATHMMANPTPQVGMSDEEFGGPQSVEEAIERAKSRNA